MLYRAVGLAKVPILTVRLLGVEEARAPDLEYSTRHPWSRHNSGGPAPATPFTDQYGRRAERGRI